MAGDAYDAELRVYVEPVMEWKRETGLLIVEREARLVNDPHGFVAKTGVEGGVAAMAAFAWLIGTAFWRRVRRLGAATHRVRRGRRLPRHRRGHRDRGQRG